MILINIEQDTMEVYIQKKVKCPLIFWSHLVVTIVQYTAGKSKGKKEKDNIKCSLFNVKSKWQQTEVVCWNTESLLYEPFDKRSGPKRTSYLKPRLRMWICREACSHHDKLISTSSFHSHSHHRSNHSPAVVHRVQVQQDDVIPVNSSRLNDNEGN